MTNASVPVEIGKLTPDTDGAAENVYIGTVVVETYCPVRYMFPLESTTISVGRSGPEPVRIVNPRTAPVEPLHLMTNTSCPDETGKVNPDAAGALVNVFIGTDAADALY
jgi:hypothetical protein